MGLPREPGSGRQKESAQAETGGRESWELLAYRLQLKKSRMKWSGVYRQKASGVGVLGDPGIPRGEVWEERPPLALKGTHEWMIRAEGQKGWRKTPGFRVQNPVEEPPAGLM